MNAKTAAAEFVNAARAINAHIAIRGSVVSVSAQFGNSILENHQHAENEVYHIVSGALVTKSSSSVWGTTSDGMGAITAQRTNVHTMNVSGCKAAFVTALAAML